MHQDLITEAPFKCDHNTTKRWDDHFPTRFMDAPRIQYLDVIGASSTAVNFDTYDVTRCGMAMDTYQDPPVGHLLRIPGKNIELSWTTFIFVMVLMHPKRQRKTRLDTAKEISPFQGIRVGDTISLHRGSLNRL